MHDPEPRMPLHLGSRATRISDLTEALYWAIDAGGLRTPARRGIARRAHVSEATVSRRFRDSRVVHLDRDPVQDASPERATELLRRVLAALGGRDHDPPRLGRAS